MPNLRRRRISFSLLFHERLEQVIENRTLYGFLEGISAGVVGIIAATTAELGAVLFPQLPDLPSGILIFALALLVLYLWRSRLNIVVTIAGSGMLGWLLFG